LARQHFESLNGLCEGLGITCALLTRFEKGKARTEILARLANGDIDLLIGTHALIQETIQFNNLGLAVIDEQHRFGVAQRLDLSRKGQAVHVLVMTATPIPRTLALTLYGDMTVSVLAEKPPGRLPIDTRLMNQDRLNELVTSLKRKIDAHEKIYWVCPLVEESELIDLAAATERYTMLQQYYGGQVGLIHGRMKADEKATIMQQFTHGNLKILVATTVIEVGVNVSDATVMVIEHAERFGLSQLHQLRGRVGRGVQQGTCILLYAGPLGKTAQSRLEALRETNDGFLLAERDLQLRGAGDMLGTRQTGLPAYKLAKLEFHQSLLHMAHDDAKLILNRDPELKTERGQALRLLLYLFERDQAEVFLKAG
jgi:ATP-dependent DNA helicase RecG